MLIFIFLLKFIFNYLFYGLERERETTDERKRVRERWKEEVRLREMRELER